MYGTISPIGDVKSEIRNVKLKIINGDYEFKFSQPRVNMCQKDLEFISQNFPNDIISGSLALKLYGLLDREINDVDIIIDDPDRYKDYRKSYYGRDEDELDTRLGFIKFQHKPGFFSRKKEYEVDFFENKEEEPYMELDFGDYSFLSGKKLKVHHPMSIINKKALMKNSSKHYDDLVHIFKVIDLVY